MKILEKAVKFEWDNANRNKNIIKHDVIDEECEEVFFDGNKKLLKDIQHSNKESRYILIGQTKLQRLLFIVFTIRKNKICVISARDINKKEKQLYEAT